MSLTVFTLAWLGASISYLPHDSQRGESADVSTIDAVVERIIDVESGGDPNAKNKRSTATGLGQFLDYFMTEQSCGSSSPTPRFVA
jgi:hypothetical protein